MIEIRIHGRGGQGGVTAAEILATAAFKDGKQSRAFPFIGTEIRGASVEAFCRISDNEIKTREFVYNPDYILLLDSSLLNGDTKNKIKEGLKRGSIAIINSKDNFKREFPKNVKVFSIDLTKIALEKIGKPFVNMPMLGAFAAVSKTVSLKSLIEAVSERLKDKGLIGKNIQAIEEAYKQMEKMIA